MTNFSIRQFMQPQVMYVIMKVPFIFAIFLACNKTCIGHVKYRVMDLFHVAFNHSH